MNSPKLTIRHIVFTGATVTPAELEFDEGCNLVWGASNTGKSFVTEAIDFMLGGSKALPDIKERQGYETIWFGFTVNGVGDCSVSRAIVGGAFTLYKGLVKTKPSGLSSSVLGQTHNHEKPDNLSNFLLNHLGFGGKLVATNTFGNKRSLSFRDLAHIMIVDEILIQAKRSPIEGGQRSDKPLEHSVFRLLLSGSDDSAITPVENPKKTRASKAIKLEFLDEMITEIDVRLATEYPDIVDLEDRDARLKLALKSIQAEFDAAQGSIQVLLEEKQSLAIDIPKVGERLDEIEVHLSRFDQLDRVYTSDMERLEALEEASFLVSLGNGRDCPLCGAGPEAQLHLQGIDDVEKMHACAVVEINKIKLLRADLKRTVIDLRSERERLLLELPKLRERLMKVEGDISDALPKVDERRSTLNEVLAARDKVGEGLALHSQKNGLLSKRAEAKKVKPVSEKDKPNLDLAGILAHEFCDVVSRVLTKWQFPGQKHVSFDDKTYDLKIDGKLRIDNGKGVRAITHAAFKIALLIFCHEKGLPHPGFVVLDTPLLTYRDPIKSPKYGELSTDEKELAQTPLKQKFFEHLYSIRELGQFIIFENVDPPNNIQDLAKVEIFLGQAGGRIGLFPPDTGV